MKLSLKQPALLDSEFHVPPQRLPPQRYILTCIAVVALVATTVRWLALSTSADAFQDDPDAYRKIATVWSITGTYGILNEKSPNGSSHPSSVTPTAFRPPLYPYFIKLFAIDTSDPSHAFIKQHLLLLHLVLGTITSISASICFYIASPALIDRLSCSMRCFLSIVCGCFVSIDPILIRQSQLIMTETLATALTSVMLLLFLTRVYDPNKHNHLRLCLWGGTIGLLFGINSLCRPTSLAWLVVYFIASFAWIAWCRWKNKAHQLVPEFSFLLIVLLTSFLTLLPWAIRNRGEMGKLCFTTTHGGYTLLLANNDSLYDHFEKTWDRNWDESPFFAQWEAEQSKTSSEIESDELANRLAKRVIASRPWDFAMSIPARLSWLWALAPNQGGLVTRCLIAAWYGSQFVLALFAIYSSLRKSSSSAIAHGLWLPICCLVISISIVHGIYWSNMRMRSVAIPPMVMLSLLGFYILFEKIYLWLRPRSETA